MIAYVKGTLDYINENEIIVECNGIGYRIMIPLSVAGELPHIGSEVRIHTYMNVREDAMQLFGFLDRDDLDMFKMLITVSGIGPKGALNILSVMSPDDLRFAILSDDAAAISKAPGIGKKTAGKLVIELKDKLDLGEAFAVKSNHINAMRKPCESDVRSEAAAALVALGYSQSEALRAVSLVDGPDEMSVEQLLKESLRKM